MLGECELRLPARKLRALGCEEHPRRERGSHRIWRNPLTGGSAVVPDYGSRDLRIGTIRAVLRNLGVGWRAFLSA
ncbi:MAG: type II toxin-antitoxin system HicA family toxin [Candidatus Poribacteria bacterium]|nr:type II toxin-antitoxin system HicA family toxin [Candidatus Poribacteria bacterium]